MKRRIVSFCAASLLITLLMSFASPEKWFMLVSEEHGYQIEFPQEPQANNQVVPSEIGELKMNIYMHDASKSQGDDNLVYMVNFTEFPAEQIHSSDTDALPEFFRNSIDGAVTNVAGKLLSEKTIQYGDYPGREIKIDFRNGMAVICSRMYLVENNLFMMQTITLTEKQNNKSITRFMDSFKLKK